MSNLEKYKKDLEELIKTGEHLFSDLNSNKDKAHDFHAEYQNWYSTSEEVIRQLLPNRLTEFIQLYSGEKRKIINSYTFTIKDWLLGIRSSTNRLTGEYGFNDYGITLMRFQNQLLILKSARKRFESSLFGIKQVVQADLFDSELEASKELNKQGFVRCGGAISGVVLEKHLCQVCEHHNISITKKDPTINDFNQILKDKNVIEVPDWRFIQHLSDLRNLCDHDKKIEPTKEQVNELISGVEKITKTIY